MIVKKTFLMALFFLTSFFAAANIKLPHIIADRMVLQQKSECTLWGKADSNEQIKITASWGQSVQTTALQNGVWSVKISTPEHGGPYSIDFVGKNFLRINDVLIGEVWLVSGQTNMEIPMIGWPPYDTIQGGPQALASADNDNIRFIMLQQKASFDLEEDNNCWWTKATSENCKPFSAMAYFYAKKLYEETGIPIGVIQCSWNGSNVESWVDLETVKTVPTLKNAVLEYERCKPLQKQLENWIKSHKTITLNSDWRKRYDGVDFFDKEASRLSYADDNWKEMELPCFMDNREGIGSYDGIVWFRKWVDIPIEWVGKKLILSLGPIDDMDVTYVNGEKIGETLGDGKWNYSREYEIPAKTVLSNEMVIAVRVIDCGNGGGLCGVKEAMCIYPEGEKDKAISIAGKWKYLPTAEFKDGVFYSYDLKTREYYNRPQVPVVLNMKTISAAYNAMINPVKNYTIRGVLISMGESNVGRSSEYLKLFPAMASSWRAAFKNPDMKFYFSQIAPYPYQAGESQCMREAQRRCQALIPNSGMVCVLDFGNRYGFHYAQKQQVAGRFAAWALNDVYDKKCEVSGPEFSQMVIKENKVFLIFTHTEGGLVCKGKHLTNFQVVDAKGVAYDAEAEINGNVVQVWSQDCKSPKNVRYAYKDWVDDVTFYNGAGLPASSFTTEKKLIDTAEY